MPKAKTKAKNILSISPHNYTYPKTTTLKNKYGTKNLKTFLDKCSHDTTKAMINLREEPLPEQFDSSYLCYIHKRLFSNTFEWAGQLRNIPFTFEDGTTAAMPEMKRTGWENAFAIGYEIQEGLQRLDQALAEKNNLQGLTREEFISEAMEMFNSLNHIHPFREGNGRTQRVFFENLAKAAGHQLEFSLVTKERMMIASVAVTEGNLEPMQHLFEDISNPEKIRVLREFMDNMKNIGRNVSDRPVMVAKQGETYTGTYRGAGFEGFALNVKGAYIISSKDYLTPEQLKTLKPGDKFTFTAPKAEELEKVLIPKEELAPLTKTELAEMAAETACIHTSRKQIQRLSKTVYGSSKALDKQMVEIIKDPNFGQKLIQQIESSPSSIANLAGFDFLCIKTQRRAIAEENVSLLCNAIINYTHAVEYTTKEILQEHQAKQKRYAQAVAMPSKNLQELLSLPQELQQEALINSPLLRQELCNLVKDINCRLSPDEHKAIKCGNHETLSTSVGISEHKAKDIITIVQNIKETYKQAQERTISRSNTLAIAH
ncbi:BID domain-containing T4SS effector [Bartonella doshiae]|uniref:protein adenylyltransferase n=2 Tax=Bartonella doshiae TaxID=33044 RepID=A0A380ZGH3_BARDO|nr:BID domain-containing T4SS effector [Bartonella doshiae]EJF78988.1 hypothetical protein MCS_01534 [Bartonella doshiae NCTC 12862 = ATCC 700133]MBB6159888.1 fido (protein-threonine AMPylation protein) [Bartonella doshiae]SUV45434.1 Probable adenosine monophosphate-protein transferase fic [Bartonella doshiae]